MSYLQALNAVSIGSCIENLFQLRFCTRKPFSYNPDSNFALFLSSVDLTFPMTEIRFPRDDIGLWGQNQPKFQDQNVDKNIDEISNCLEVSNWVFVQQISLTSSIFSLMSMGARWKRTPQTLLIFATGVLNSGLATPSCSSFDFGIMKIKSTRN